MHVLVGGGNDTGEHLKHY